MNYGMMTVGIVVMVAPVLLSHLLLGPVAPADLQVFVHSANPSTNRCESELPFKRLRDDSTRTRLWFAFCISKILCLIRYQVNILCKIQH